MMRIPFLIIGVSFLASVQSLHAEDDLVADADSTARRVEMLDEVIVKSRHVVRNGNTTMLFPTNRDRRFAAGGIDVLSNMNIPEISVNPLDKSITAYGGEPVSLFVDFQPVSTDQMRNIRPQDIERIDIIRSPEDPRFQNSRVVANYIMKKYEYGGYTKLTASQAFPTTKGNYEVYSKLSYKRMTYDVTAGTNYSYSGNSSGEEDYSVFRFPSEIIERQSVSLSNQKRSLSPSISVRAKYNATNLSITNTAGFNYTRLNPSDNRNLVTFSDIFPTTESNRNASIINKGAAWNGNCWFRMPDKSSIYFNGGFNWTENRDLSTYILGEFSPIVNNIYERLFAANGGLNYSRRIGRHSISVGLGGGWSSNRLDYLSSDITDVYYREGYGQIGVSADLSFERFMVSPSVTLSISSERLNDDIATKWLPKAFVPFNIQLSQVSVINGSLEYAKGATSASYRSPVAVRQNEIEVLRGNENLDDYDMYNAHVGYSHYFGSWLNMYLDARFNMEDNVVVPVYSAETSETGLPLMVTDITNNGSVSNTSIALTLAGEYFDRKLALAVEGSLSYFTQRGNLRRDEINPNFYVNATYYLGAFRINGYYSLRHRDCTAWYDLTTSAYYYISGSWSWRDLFVDVRFSNPFRRSYVSQISEFSSKEYDNRHIYKTPSFHQAVTLTLSYSFGYGKKVDHRNELRKLNDGASIILKK